MIKIEVLYIDEQNHAFHKTLEMPKGAKVANALEASGLYEKYPECRNRPVGIFSKKVSMDLSLQANDRIEVYRPLTLDPMIKRRIRAREKTFK